MAQRHSFWSVLGPAEAPRFGSGAHASRGGIDPHGADAEDSEARVAELVVILGEINRVSGRCLQMFSRIREACDLTGIEVLTLIGIAHATTPPTVPQIGRSLGHPRQVIQRAVRVLEEKGLVQPLPNPGHKRAALLVATDRGHELGRAIDAQAAEVIGELADGLALDLGELSTMSRGLLALRDRIDERMSDKPD
jgi:DNA-binding MarR family transcriptional regulator